jgi:hypothetical protein
MSATKDKVFLTDKSKRGAIVISKVTPTWGWGLLQGLDERGMAWVQFPMHPNTNEREKWLKIHPSLLRDETEMTPAQAKNIARIIEDEIDLRNRISKRTKVG